MGILSVNFPSDSGSVLRGGGTTELLAGSEKSINITQENTAKNYINAQPQLLFVADYIVGDSFAGVLLVWEKYLNSTHYQVFKKNMFKFNSVYERILFLDAASLQEETSNYIDYLNKVVGLNLDPNNIIAILDTNVKSDRIYEYKISATRIPQAASEVNYSIVLQSKGLTTIKVPSLTDTLFQFSANTTGSEDLAWTIALLNDNVAFFGRESKEKSLSSILVAQAGSNNLFTADRRDIFAIIGNSISLFALHDTVSYLIKSLGGLNSIFYNFFINSLDKNRNVFSFDTFRGFVMDAYPNLTSSAVATLPQRTGSEAFNSAGMISSILNFVNDFYIAVLYLLNVVPPVVASEETSQETTPQKGEVTVTTPGKAVTQ